jgi:hypothetical protein
MHIRHAAARSRKRKPPIVMIATIVQPTWRTSVTISATPTLHTIHASRPRPSTPVTTPERERRM